MKLVLGAILCLALCAVPINSVNNKLKEVFAWKFVDYAWEKPEDRDAAIASGEFVPANNLPLGLEVWKDKLFITVPRWKDGVVSTLNYIKITDEEGTTPMPPEDHVTTETTADPETEPTTPPPPTTVPPPTTPPPPTTAPPPTTPPPPTTAPPPTTPPPPTTAPPPTTPPPPTTAPPPTTPPPPTTAPPPTTPPPPTTAPPPTTPPPPTTAPPLTTTEDPTATTDDSPTPLPTASILPMPARRKEVLDLLMRNRRAAGEEDEENFDFSIFTRKSSSKKDSKSKRKEKKKEESDDDDDEKDQKKKDKKKKDRDDKDKDKKKKKKKKCKPKPKPTTAVPETTATTEATTGTETTAPPPPPPRSPALIPYPSFAANRVPVNGTIPDGPKPIVSVFRVWADTCDRLWVMDTGVSDILGKTTVVSKPRIIVYNLNNDEHIKTYEFKDGDSEEHSFFANIIVDTDPQNCNKAFAYVPDLGGYGIVSYDFANDKSRRIKHNYFHFDPLAGNMEVGGVNFQWTDGVFSIALSKPQDDGFRTAYFHCLASTKEFSVSTKVLKNGDGNGDSYYDYKLVGDRGEKSQSSASYIHEDTGVMFYTQLQKDSVNCWNTNKPLVAENLDEVASDNETMIFTNDLKVDREGNLWVLTDKLPVFIYRGLDDNNVNYRIFTATVDEAVAGTKCAP